MNVECGLLAISYIRLKTGIQKLHYLLDLEERGNEASLGKLGAKHLRKIKIINVPWDDAEDTANDRNHWKALTAHMYPAQDLMVMLMSLTFKNGKPK